MHIRTHGVIAALAFVCAGCAPTVRATALNGTFEPRRGVEEVAVFSTKSPECPYQEIAILRAYAGFFTNADAALEALKRRALSMGSDAVVGVRLINSGGEYSTPGYTATAVRFTDSGCVR